MAQQAAVFFAPLLIVGALLSGCTSNKAPGEVFQLGLVETMRLGDESAGDSVLFGWIGGLVTVDGAGRIFVGEAQHPKIYVFSAAGKLLSVVGQPGEGPGEFQQLGLIHVGPGDSLYAYDRGQDRVSVFEPESFDLAYIVRVPRDELYSPSQFVGAAVSGLLFKYVLPFWGRSDKDLDIETRVMVVDRQGRIIGEPLITLPAVEELITESPRGGIASLGVPFGRIPVIRMGPSQSVYSGWNESLDIAVTEATGLASVSISLGREYIPVTATDIEEWLEGRASFVRNAILNSDIHSTKPAYEDFLVDDLGRVWVNNSSSEIPDATEWLVIDTESRIYGTLTVLPGISLEAVRDGRVYAVDENDSAVVVYEVSR